MNRFFERFTAVALMLLALPVLAAAQQGTPAGELSGEELLAALRSGGYVLYIRHAETDRSVEDTSLESCDTQQNLNDEGREQSRTIGEAVTTLGIPLGRVITSPYCRTRDTAQIAFGWVDEQLEEVTEAAELAVLLATPPQKGTNAVIVGHGMPHAEAAGVPLLDRGETGVYLPLAKGSVREVARLQPEDWLALSVSD